MIPPDRQRRLRRQNLFIGLALVALVLFTLLNTLLGPETSVDVDISRMEPALLYTKLAYAARGPEKALVAGPSRSQEDAFRAGLSQSLIDKCIKEWREQASSKTGTPNDWRRLGITLFLFDRPGGFAAFRRAYTPIPSGHSSPVPHLTPALARAIWAIGTPPPPDQERALWQSIYGPKPLQAQQARALQPLLARMNLGWFEQIAEARLYSRAGLHAEALRAAMSADASARSLTWLTWLIDLLVFLGIPVLIVFGLTRLLTKYSAPAPPDPYPGTLLMPAWDLPGHTAGVPAESIPLQPAIPPSDSPPPVIVEQSAVLPTFSYRARMIAFVTYLGLMVVLRFPAPLLHRLAQRLPIVTVARLDVALNLILLPLLAGIAVMMLRRAAAAEAPDGRPPSLRKTLAVLGYRTRHPLMDLGKGLLGYLMVMPLTLAASWLSTWIFHRYHTPIHPIEILEMALQTPLDHFLLMMEAAVMAPFVEETMFRGLLYPALRARWGVAGGVMASGAIFAMLHPTMPGQFLPLWVLGIALALAYEWCGSLLPGMVMHALQNTISTLESFLIYAR